MKNLRQIQVKHPFDFVRLVTSLTTTTNNIQNITYFHMIY